MSPLTPILIGGEVSQALPSLSGDAGLPKEVLMEMENITTLSNEASVVEVVVLVERTPVETTRLPVQQWG